MPYFDFGELSPSADLDDHDYCVVGAGAAGILIACKLAGHRKKVLLVESGHFFEDEKRQVLNETVQTGKRLDSAGWGRKRAVGGTTIAWGGQSLPFARLDFEERAWVPDSGWPLTKTDLWPHYMAANQFMQIDTLGFGGEIFDLFGLKKAGFNDDELIQHFSKWAPEPNFRKVNEKVLQESVTVLYNAQVTRITVGDARQEINLVIEGFSNNRRQVKVPKLILSTGGIETNRLLLSNRHQFQSGIGNQSGWLGKCFMEHPCMEVGILSDVKNPFDFQKNFNTHIRQRIRYSPKISISRHAQESLKLLNASTSFLFDYGGGPNPYEAVKDFVKHKNIRQLFNHIQFAPGFAASLVALSLHRFYYKHRAVPKLGVMLEQAPTTDSYISLSTTTDRFGIPNALVNWSITELSWRTAIEFMDFVQAEFERLGIGSVKFNEQFTLGNSHWADCLSDVNHHMGGTRMSASVDMGVVDPHCKIWGTDNIYISSASVFPTSSHSNPTLTLLALSDRLVQHLIKQN